MDRVSGRRVALAYGLTLIGGQQRPVHSSGCAPTKGRGDLLVYELYGLTDEEIAIVQEAMTAERG